MANACPKCGHDNPIGVNVCSECATPLPRVCQNCGFASPPNFKFCGNCGASFVAAPITRGSDEEKLQRLGSMPAALAEKITQVGKQIEGERRTVTVLFADITGFTSLSEKLDPEEVYNLIDSTLKAFIDEIYKHEGTLDKFMGDGVMALFGAPVAHEDDPARAVRAALGMQSALRRVNEDLEVRLGISLKVRIGLNSGTVVVGSVGSDLRMDYTALGDTVNVASRLQSVAEPGTILVSRSVYEPTKPLFDFRELGSIRVKGRVEPVEIFEAIAPKSIAGRVRGIPGLAAPMVGRQEEFARLRQAIEELAANRRGQIVLVTGEAGIGKSRLTAELKGYAASKPVRVLEGACLSYGQSAYEVFLRLLRNYFDIGDGDTEEIVRDKIEQTVRRVLPQRDQVAQVLPYIENLFSIRIVEKELAERVRHLEPSQLQQQTFLAVHDLLSAEAKQQPLVLIFEDVHWIDKLSLDLLTFLLGTVERVPILIYTISRPTEGAAAPHIEKLAGENYPLYFTHIPLLPLSQADSIALVDLLLTIAELPENLKQIIPQRAEGNPFFLEEIIRTLIDRGTIRRAEGRWQVAPDADLASFQVPRTLQGLLMTRVDHLSEGARQTIQCAAVIGRDFSYRLLAGVVDGSRTLQDDVQELEDRELIHRLGEANELEYRFHHILIQETVYNSLLIRRRERLHHKIAEGIETLFKERLEDHIEQLAFHFSESKDTERSLPYLIRAGTRAAGRFANDEAQRYYRLAADGLTKTNPTPEQRVEVYAGLGDVQNFVGDYDGALNSYLIASEMIRTLASAQMLRYGAEIMRRIGRVHERRGDYVEALHWLDNALHQIDRDPNSDKAVERVRVYNDIGWVNYRRGQIEEAYQWRMRSLQIVEGTDHYNEMASAYNGLAALFSQKGDWARCLAYAEKSLRLREMIGDSYGVAQSHNNLGIIAVGQCDWDQALRHLERSLEIRQRIGHTLGISQLYDNVGVPYREKGDYARATELFEKGLQVAQKIKNMNTTCLALNNLAHVQILQGHFRNAITYLNQSVVIATDIGHKENLAEAQWLLAEAYAGQKQLDQSRHSAEQAHTIATQIGNRFIEAEVLRTLCKIARARHAFEEADGYLQRSLAIFGELKNPCELAKSQFELALLQRDRGCLAEARALLETAHSTFVRLGAEGERKRARSELDALATARPAATHMGE
ncbi:MAG: tetratricopeptide repeat protein [Chloroflexi bacterium]|nr:tetratricopeptide repeat protein [Chloroflexota bacterium]